MQLFIEADRNPATGWAGFEFAGNGIEIGIPKALLGVTATDAAYQFQWADNARSGGDMASFAVDGDAAPDRRFRYAFASKSGSPIRAPLAPVAGGMRFTWRRGSRTGTLSLPVTAPFPRLRKAC